MAETLEQKYLRLRPEYIDWWRRAKLDPEARDRVAAQVKRIINYRPVYEKAVANMMIPWWFVAVLHYRESGLDFKTHLHNGDPLSARTVHVPAGRPLSAPPFSWEVSAADALQMKGLHKLTDVSIERLLFEAERFNGFGYRNRNDESVYVWSGTNMSDEKGKFVRDGVYDRNAPEKQLGVAALMLELQEAGVELTAKKEAEQLTKEAGGAVILAGGGGAAAAVAFGSWWPLIIVGGVVLFIAVAVIYVLWKRSKS